MAYDFRDSDEARAFIASGDSRETSKKIMQAIVFFANNLEEAEMLWDGAGWGIVCNPLDMWEHVTNNGRIDADEFCWGAAGTHWWADLEREIADGKLEA